MFTAWGETTAQDWVQAPPVRVGPSIPDQLLPQLRLEADAGRRKRPNEQVKVCNLCCGT
jgi:hypothetical protein